MGQALDVVNRYYQAFDRKGDGWKELITDDIQFTGPLQSASGAQEFIALTEPFLQAHKSTRVIDRMEKGDVVSAFHEYTVATPAGGTLKCAVAEWIRVVDGRIAEFKLYYDPRAFAKAFGIPA